MYSFSPWGQNKNKKLFPAPDRLLENVATGNIFWVIWRRLFKQFWLSEIMTGSF